MGLNKAGFSQANVLSSAAAVGGRLGRIVRTYASIVSMVEINGANHANFPFLGCLAVCEWGL